MVPRLLTSLVLGISALMPGVAGADESAHDYAFTAIEGEALPLSRYRGDVMLIVNTASFCGFTEQYDGLQELWERYRDRGLVVIGVPSNDFGNQEPGTEAEIKNFCEVNFSVDFPLTEKVKVTGSEAHPFYRWAVRELGSEARPRWNFHKYLIDPDGALVGWFPTSAEPASPEVAAAIERQLDRLAPSPG